MNKATKITADLAPLNSIDIKNTDYIDAYQIKLPDSASDDIALLVNRFFSGKPEWVSKLMDFRNRLVKPFGLKSDSSRESKMMQSIEKDRRLTLGEKFGVFEVKSIQGDRVVIGQTDRHLDFVIDFFLSKDELKSKILTVSTQIRFHNYFGRLYFYLILPFHRLVVTRMMKKLAVEV